MLTSFSDRGRVSDALAAGAVGYLLKDCEPAELLTAVRSAAAGHVPLDPRVAGVLLPEPGGRPEDGLSPRETEVLRLVAQGLANKQIGRRLGISERTVKAHLGRVFRQLGVADRTSAALWAHDHLATPDGPTPGDQDLSGRVTARRCRWGRRGTAIRGGWTRGRCRVR